MEPNKKIVVKRAGRARARRADEARPRTNDRVADAQQAAETYRITTPLVADEDRDMTGAYDVLGQGCTRTPPATRSSSSTARG